MTDKRDSGAVGQPPGADAGTSTSGPHQGPEAVFPLEHTTQTKSSRSSDEELARAYAAVSAVPDPEIPVITIADLGVLHGIERREGRIVVRLTPTYTGCPATLAIRLDVEAALAAAGIADAVVETVLAPAWTTDDISAEGRRKLHAYGIAPPPNAKSRGKLLFGDHEIACPRCGSSATARISEFGSTPCKSLWRCESCREPFDVFKCI